MGKSESKLVNKESNAPEPLLEEHEPELSEAIKGLCEEARALFEERYAQEIQNNKFAKNVGLWPTDSGLYIREGQPRRFVLIISGRGDRASDIALKAVNDHLKPYIGKLHLAKSSDIPELIRLYKQVDKWEKDKNSWF